VLRARGDGRVGGDVLVLFRGWAVPGR
jgi:hypothetical protein